METEIEKINYIHDDKIQQKRHEIKMDEDVQRKKNLMEVTKSNVDVFTQEQYHGLSPKEYR